MRILIVEDSVTMRRVMEMTFAGEDAELLAVESGELALERGPDFAPDVAFVDTTLPGIDGYEVVRALKSDPRFAGTGVILMASQHRPLDAARASEVGADDRILKPFDTQEAIDKASSVAGGIGAEVLDEDVASVPEARPASSPPIAIGPSHRPTPPPLPVSGGAGPQGRPLSSAPRVSRTPLSGAAVTMSPAAAPSLQASAPATRVVPPTPAPPSPSAPPSASISEAPLEVAGASEALSTSVVARLETLGLTPEQVEGVLKLSAEVVERVVWEVVPELAEALIREELQRIMGD